MNKLIAGLKTDVGFLATIKSRIQLIGFVAVVVLLFLFVYEPFDMNAWPHNLFVSYVLIGLGVMLVVQFVIRPFFVRNQYKVYHVLFWFCVEILLIAILIYNIYTPQFETFNEKLGEFWFTLNRVILVIFGPYILFVMYLILNNRFIKLEEMLTVEDQPIPEKKASNLLRILGDNNKVIFAVNPNNILHVQSSGNYLEIYFLKSDVPTKEIVRLRMKEFEEKVAHLNFIRIHRSNLVNIDKIASVEKTRKGYSLFVQHCPNNRLTVSSSFKENFDKALHL